MWYTITVNKTTQRNGVLTMNNTFKFLDAWYRFLDELIFDLEDHGFTVEMANRELIECYGEDTPEDQCYILHLGGTERTITIESVETLSC